MRLLWVVPRYGVAIVGGAETLVRALATRGTPAGWSSEIATTCAVDHVTLGERAAAGRDASRTACACTASRSGRATRPATTSCTPDPRADAGVRRRARVAREQRLVARARALPRGRGRRLRPRRLRAVPLRHDALGRADRAGAQRAAAVPARRAVRVPRDGQGRDRGRPRLHLQLRRRGAARPHALPRAGRARGRHGLRPPGAPRDDVRGAARARPLPALRRPPRGGQAGRRRRRVRDALRGRAAGRAAARADRPRPLRAAARGRHGSSSVPGYLPRRSSAPPTPRRWRSSTRRSSRASRSCSWRPGSRGRRCSPRPARRSCATTARRAAAASCSTRTSPTGTRLDRLLDDDEPPRRDGPGGPRATCSSGTAGRR